GMDISAERLGAMQQAASLLVTNYGADGSGTADADPGIQLALNAARDLGGAQVVVPPGIFLTGDTLRIYDNTRLTLMAGAELRRHHAGTMIINGDAGQDLGGYTGHSNIVIEGGLWNMRGTTVGLTASAMCISIGHATDITIRDLEVRDLPGFHAIELNSTSHGLIQNCRFRGYVDPGGRDFSEAIQLDLAKSAGVFGGFGPYDHTPTEDVLVIGCHFGASGTAGTTAWPRGVGSHSATITKWHRRIRILGNSFE
ncbi:glycosyl hydrolase family 28-related protein, partial [Streptomyces umbrinus]